MAQHETHSSNGSNHGGHHLVPIPVYIRVWLALLVGTVITVAVSYVDFGNLNMFIAMIIATVKAFLVMAFFMGLKYEGLENTATILSTMIFLGVFITLTSFDVFWRPDLQPVPIDVSAAAMSSGPVDVKKVSQKTNEALEKGKTLFAQNCASCHGDKGMGDGPAAASLSPRPRNFTQDQGWKNNRKLSGIFTTLTKGLPGTPMPSFASLSVEDRFALAHYVQAFGPQVVADTPAELDALGLNKNVAAKPELTQEQGVARYVGVNKFVSEQSPSGVITGSVPRHIYCNLPAQYRPRWCQ